MDIALAAFRNDASTYDSDWPRTLSGDYACMNIINWLRKLFEEFGRADGLRLGLRTDLHKVIALVATPLRG